MRSFLLIEGSSLTFILAFLASVRAGSTFSAAPEFILSFFLSTSGVGGPGSGQRRTLYSDFDSCALMAYSVAYRRELQSRDP